MSSAANFLKPFYLILANRTLVDLP